MSDAIQIERSVLKQAYDAFDDLAAYYPNSFAAGLAERIMPALEKVLTEQPVKQEPVAVVALDYCPRREEFMPDGKLNVIGWLTATGTNDLLLPAGTKLYAASIKTETAPSCTMDEAEKIAFEYTIVNENTPAFKYWFRKGFKAAMQQTNRLSDQRLNEIESEILTNGGDYKEVLRAIADEACGI